MRDHSPTPWEAFSSEDERGVCIRDAGTHRTLCEKLTAADAALIERAVNTHDKALAALKDAQAHLLRLTSTVAQTDLLAAGAGYRLQIVIAEMEGRANG